MQHHVAFFYTYEARKTFISNQTEHCIATLKYKCSGIINWTAIRKTRRRTCASQEADREGNMSRCANLSQLSRTLNTTDGVSDTQTKQKKNKQKKRALKFMNNEHANRMRERSLVARARNYFARRLIRSFVGAIYTNKHGAQNTSIHIQRMSLQSCHSTPPACGRSAAATYTASYIDCCCSPSINLFNCQHDLYAKLATATRDGLDFVFASNPPSFICVVCALNWWTFISPANN